METKNNDSFVFYKTNWEIIKELSPSDQFTLLRAIINKQFYGTETELTGINKAIFNEVDLLISKARRKYNASVENGKKGGAPKGNQNARKQPKNNPTKQPKNNLNVNDNDNEYDYVDADGNTESIDSTATTATSTNTNNIDDCLCGYDSLFSSIKTKEIRDSVEEWFSLVGYEDFRLTPEILRARLKTLGEDCGNNPEIIAYSIKQSTLNGWKQFYRKEPKATTKVYSPAPAVTKALLTEEEINRRIREKEEREKENQWQREHAEVLDF